MPDVRQCGQTKLEKNQAVYVDGIRRALARKLLVVVTGAGVSLSATEQEDGSSLPQLTWNGLLLNALDYLDGDARFGPSDQRSLQFHRGNLTSNATADDLMQAANYAKDQLVKHRRLPTWLNIIFGELHKPEFLRKPGVLEELQGFQLEGAKLMTTNYDHLLDRFCKLQTIKPSNKGDLQQFAAGDLEGVVHIHGDYQSPDDVVINIVDYNKITLIGVIEDILKALFTTHTLLFVGTGEGLQDPHFGQLLEWASKYYDTIRHKHYVLVRDKEMSDTDHGPLLKVRYGPTYQHLVPFLHMLRDPQNLFGIWKLVTIFKNNSGNEEAVDKPRAVHTTPDGTSNGVLVYVLYDDRVQKYHIDYSKQDTERPSAIFQNQWGSEGKSDGQFDEPLFLWVSVSGEVYVSDTEQHRIQVFDSEGTWLRKWGVGGIEKGNFRKPWGIWGVDPEASKGKAVKPEDVEIYVCDKDKKRVQVFNGNGEYRSGFGDSGWKEVTAIVVLRTDLSRGRRVFVSDRGKVARVEEWVSKDGLAFTRVRWWGQHGKLPGQFRFAEGLAMCPHTQTLYVVDADNHRVQAFTDQGNYIHEFGIKGLLPGQFDCPAAVAVDQFGHVYVCDMENYRVQVFEPIWSPSLPSASTSSSTKLPHSQASTKEPQPAPELEA
jgi:DNA-binding beta-propeller fold protein YncE